MMQQYPIISCMQKIVIYETKARFFVVGSNNTETRFRVLKIDRTEPRELHIVEDKLEYTPRQIRELLYMIDMGNRSKVLQKGSSGLSRRVSTFGLVGFVRFLEGYYIVLITKRRRVALIGSHTVYKIEDTSLVYIPNDTVRYTHPDEPRYVKMFQSMDLSSNFYFSYSYDLTHTLQYNMTPVKHLDTMANVTISVDPWPPGGSGEGGGDVDDGSHVEEASNLTFCAEDEEVNTAGVEQPPDQRATSRCGGTDSDKVYGVRTEPCWKFVWNFHMLKNVCTLLHSDWLLYIIHGFIGQSNIVVFGRPIYLTLIARRSRQFAGTRFLKRGANFEGYVANEVETEQVVHDASVLSLDKARLTAFVQMRGSVPALWSQDISNKMMPKPMINVDQADPFGDVAGKHFDQVLKRYGTPVIILDLVKTKEKKQRERIVREQMIKALQYLNQFLPHEHTIRYIGFDMAKVTKSKNTNVLLRLAKIAEYCVKKTGFFHTGPHRAGGSEGVSGAPPGQGVGQKQHGVVRTNCVDCLDRTNTAQFAVGKCALAFQLHNLGVLDTPCLEFDTDCVRMLEDLYEDHGDILALQYGGSQLVHRIKSYRKIAPWTSSSRDIMHTLSRYYSNTFSDADRQHSMNLFLGTFTPKEGQLNIWELPTDFYLHNPCTLYGPTPRTRSYTQWWQTEVINCLPLSYEEESKGTQGETVVIRTNRLDERLDGYWEYYHPYLLTTLEELFSFHMNNSIRDFMPKCVNSYSPFVLRVRPGRRQEESGTTEANPNVSGKDSSSSLTSVGSDGSTSSISDIEGDFTELEDHASAEDDSKHKLVSLKDMFSTMEQIYGVNIHEPSQYSGVVYRRFIQIGENATKTLKKTERCAQAERRTTNLVQMSTFPLDSCYHVVPPKVSTRSRDLYNTYVKRGIHGAEFPGKCDMRLYHEYVLSNYK